MKNFFFSALCFIFTGGAFAQNGNQLIQQLCGCFDVTFQYAETFSHQPAYKFHDREFISGGTELSLPIEVSNDKVVIQHLLVINDTFVIKHWREEWQYESPELWRYKGNRLWVKEKMPASEVKGKWTQTVWEVSDEPRYQGYSPFVELDNKIIWQSTADAPLPRREYTVREDYNILRRTNRIVLNSNGYVHEQDNYKVQRASDGTEKILVEERGLNTYTKLPDASCQSALEFWKKNESYWTMVRNIWNEEISKRSSLQLHFKVEGKQLHDYLNKLSYSYAKHPAPADQMKTSIRAEINKFIVELSATMADNHAGQLNK
ncbi:MAG TPA: hypothetical protein DEU93_10270 [Chitinophagaceae bacterium]|nr:hypothetical protein [Chitinophagaceae bacterium]HML56815.1 hypothetical protein [Ferruginibacter sp.]